MSVPVRFQCPTCHARSYWCRYCQVRHCPTCAPHVSRRRQYLAKNLIIQRRDGQCRIMSARRYAHLTGASRGGTITAGRPNPGRFTPETARKAALKAWATRWRHSAYDPTLRVGRPRKNRPAVNREAVRAQFEAHPIQGLWFDRQNGCWWLTSGDITRRISERATLRRLGLLPTGNQNWVPKPDEPIIKTTIGRLPKLRRGGKRS